MNMEMYINEIYNSYKLNEYSTSKKFLLVQNEENNQVKIDIR